MSTVASHSPAAADAPASTAVTTIERIVAAVRGDPSDTLVLGAAAELARRHHASLTAITVFEPHVVAPHLAKTRRHPMEDQERREAAAWLRRVRAQLRAVRLPHERWPLLSRVGEPAAQIAKLAARLRPDLVVVGLGRPTRVARELGSHTAVRLAQLVGGPLLAVSRDQLPAWHTGLVLVDGRPHDAAVLCTAASLLEPPARVLLAATRGASDARALDAPVCAACESLPGVRCERVVAERDLEARASELAERAAADVIASALYGGTPAVRALTNYRAVRLLLEASCSVLLVPDCGWAPDAATGGGRHTTPASEE